MTDPQPGSHQEQLEQRPAAATPQSSAQPKPSERFYRYFQQELTGMTVTVPRPILNQVAPLQEQIARIGDTAAIGGERADAVDHCLAGITRLSQEVKDASGYVPAYDQRTYAEAIKALTEKLQQTRSALAPRTKFQFKSSLFKRNPADRQNHGPETVSQGAAPPATDSSLSVKPTSDERLSTNKPLTDGVEEQNNGSNQSKPGIPALKQGSVPSTSAVTISDRAGERIVLPSVAGRATTSASITNVRRCIVDISAPTSSAAETGRSFATLTVRNIRDSLLLCGTVDGPAHVTDVSNSVIVASCGQFRMHQCHGCDVYLQVKSRPIIEDCDHIRFAPSPGTHHHSSNAGSANENEEGRLNLWSEVDDFKWLRAEPSPHWSVLPEAERVQRSVWREGQSGEREMEIGETLEAAGVKGMNAKSGDDSP